MKTYAETNVPTRPNPPLDSRITSLENLNKAYGIYWDGGTGSTRSRRGAAVGKVFSPTVGTTGAVNDFESIKPWSDCKLCNLADNGAVNAYYGEPGFTRDGTNGQVMLEIPKFYYKVVITGDARESWVSPEQLAGFAVHPAFVVNGVEKAKIYVAAYMGSEVSSKLVSKTGVVPAKNYTRAQFRTKARARGTGWGICDLTTWSALQLLLAVMTANLDAQASVGKGISEMPYTATHLATVAETAVNRIIVSNANAALYTVGWLISIGTSQGGQNVAIDRTITSIDVYDASNTAVVFDGAAVNIAIGNMLYAAPQKTGGADALGNKTGRAAGTDGKTEVSFMGLQGMWGNWWQLIDGANMDSSYYMWYNDNPATHADDTFVLPYKRINHVLASEEGYIRRLGYDVAEPWSMLTSEVGGSSSGPVGDYFSRSGTPGDRILFVGGNWSYGVIDGPWYWRANYASSAADWSFGARLLYKPA